MYWGLIKLVVASWEELNFLLGNSQIWKHKNSWLTFENVWSLPPPLFVISVTIKVWYVCLGNCETRLFLDRHWFSIDHYLHFQCFNFAVVLNESAKETGIKINPWHLEKLKHYAGINFFQESTPKIIVLDIDWVQDDYFPVDYSSLNYAHTFTLGSGPSIISPLLIFHRSKRCSLFIG